MVKEAVRVCQSRLGSSTVGSSGLPQGQLMALLVARLVEDTSYERRVLAGTGAGASASASASASTSLCGHAFRALLRDTVDVGSKTVTNEGPDSDTGSDAGTDTSTTAITCGSGVDARAGVPPGPMSVLAGLWCLDSARISSACRALVQLLFVPITTPAAAVTVHTHPNLSPGVNMSVLVDAMTTLKWLCTHQHYFRSEHACIGECISLFANA